METRNSSRNFLWPFPNFGSRISSFAASAVLALAGCGAPGDPHPPRPVTPVAVTDLAAQQSGGSVVLTFTLPTRSTDGKALAEFPDVEIYRGYALAAAPLTKTRLPERLVYTVPSALVETYLTDRDPTAPRHVRFEDPVRPEDFQAHGAEQWVYAVRTRASQRRSSETSNVVALRVLPMPAAVSGVTATVTEAGVKLQWTSAPPSATASVVGYRVYRAQVAEGKEAEAMAQPSKAELASAPRLLAVTSAAEGTDTEIEFGRGYRYTVRSVAQSGAESVESADSEPVVVVPRDTFPPAAPSNPVAVPVPATADAPAHIELSWSISAEPDVAGYSVYRSDGTQEGKITPDLLLTPSFRDTSVAPGRRYTYRVTATDRAGNESARSEPVSESVPSP